MIKRKGRSIKIIAVIMILLCPVVDANAITGTEVMRVLGGAWSGTTRVIPMLARYTGSAAGGAWYKIPFTPTGIGLMAACVLGQYAWDKWGSKAWDDFFNENNYRKNGTDIQKKTATTYQPKAGSATATSVAAYKAWLKANWVPNSNSQLMYFYTSSAASIAAQNAADHTGEVWLTENEQPGATGFNCTGAYARTSDWRTRSWCYSTTPGDFESVDTWENKTTEQARTDLVAAISNSTVTDVEKALWNEIERTIIQEKDGVVSENILNQTNASGVPLETVLNQQAEAAINGGSLAEEGTQGGIVEAISAMGSAIVNAINAIPTTIGGYITTAVESIRTMLGVNDTVTDVSNTEIDANENTTVIGSQASDLATAKQETNTILDTLFDSVSGLTERMQTKINGMVNVGAGVCSFNMPVFGHTAVLDFCSVDLSTIRMAVLFVGTVAAVMILLL